MPKDRNIDLNTSGNLPASDASYEGATNGAAMSQGALRRGYTVLDKSHDDLQGLDAPRQDVDGSTYVGDPYERGGFLNRPQGWER